MGRTGCRRVGCNLFSVFARAAPGGRPRVTRVDAGTSRAHARDRGQRDRGHAAGCDYVQEISGLLEFDESGVRSTSLCNILANAATCESTSAGRCESTIVVRAMSRRLAEFGFVALGFFRPYISFVGFGRFGPAQATDLRQRPYVHTKGTEH